MAHWTGDGKKVADAAALHPTFQCTVRNDLNSEQFPPLPYLCDKFTQMSSHTNSDSRNFVRLCVENGEARGAAEKSWTALVPLTRPGRTLGSTIYFTQRNTSVATWNFCAAR